MRTSGSQARPMADGQEQPDDDDGAPDAQPSDQEGREHRPDGERRQPDALEAPKTRASIRSR